MVKPLKPNSLISFPRHLGSISSFPQFSSNSNLYEQSQSQSRPIPSHGRFPNLVDSVCKILNDPLWFKNLELKHMSPKLKPHHVVKIIDTHHHTESLVKFFYWVSKSDFYKHDIGCFIAMLDRLIRDRLLGPADHIRILMVKTCKNEEELSRVVDYLTGISKKNFGYSLYSCNTLLIQLGRFQMVGVARDVYTQFLNSGVKPSLLTFNTMINIFCKKGMVKEAEAVLSQMFQYDLNPDAFTYTSLILGHCRKRNLDAAFGVFDRMKKEGCDPSAATYSTDTLGFLKLGLLKFWG